MATANIFFTLYLTIISLELHASISSYDSMNERKSLSIVYDSISEGKSLSVENRDDVLTSEHGTFSAGFHPVGENSYTFAVWFNEPSCFANCTVVWMANRDYPVNGRYSKIMVLKSGDLVLKDAGGSVVWRTDTGLAYPVTLTMQEDGNLVLRTSESTVLWQSFDHPTNTLVPKQPLVKTMQLVSSRSATNHSSGFYKMFFDNNNVIYLLYDGPDTTSIYWPDPDIMSWEAGRSSYNSSRIAVLDSLGAFSSTDGLEFHSSDYGVRSQKRLTMDFDGNVRLYSRQSAEEKWVVSWQAISQPCRVHGLCGPNSLCTYSPSSVRKCSCLPGFRMKDHTDWSLGCEPEFDVPCNGSYGSEATEFLLLTRTEFYGYDFGFHPNMTLGDCKKICSESCDCKGFQLKFVKHNYPSNVPYCYVKSSLLNGHQSPSFPGDIYLKVPKNHSFNESLEGFMLGCSKQDVKKLERSYLKRHDLAIAFLIYFGIIIGAIESLGIMLSWCLLRRTSQPDPSKQGYALLRTGFRKFSYAELKRATKGFTQEIGRGSAGIVYKGVLSDKRVAAIKVLSEANGAEAEFLAEVSTIGRLNHMNLIEIWGYCAEGTRRLLVYKYMENGSLAGKIVSNALSCGKMHDIAVGVAKGLAYIHDESLEWVLHCDIKPQNVLLDENYDPKVSDFGLSRPSQRGSNEVSAMSRIRGTRGYMAPEWVMNFPITAKVDVYSYGVVLLEMVTGKSPTLEVENISLVTWVKSKVTGDSILNSSKKLIRGNLTLEGENDKCKIGVLVDVGLKCVHEDMNARPSMTQVVEMLLNYENLSFT